MIHTETTEAERIKRWENFMRGVKSNEELGYPAPKKVIKEVYSMIFHAGGQIPATQIKS